jgi:hypothetical protein
LGGIGERVGVAERWVDVLLNCAPALKPRIQQHLAHSRKIHIAEPKFAENALPARIVKAGTVGNHIGLHRRVDVFEMHVTDAVDMALHKGHRIKAGIGVVAGVEADLQDTLVHLIQQPFQLRLKIHEATSMGVNANRQSVLFCTHLRDVSDAVAIGPIRPGPFVRLRRRVLLWARGAVKSSR